MTNCIVSLHPWKDLKAWEDYGISLSTTSNQAAKMLDALIAQLYTFSEDESLGGIHGTIGLLKQADPYYVLGPLLESQLQLTDHHPETCPELRVSLDEMENLAKTQQINEWERKLVTATKHAGDGNLNKALPICEEIICDNPLDFFTLRLGHNMSLRHGDYSRMEVSMPKVMKMWTPDLPLFGYIQGLYGFVLNESKLYVEAEEYTSKALTINPHDCWSTHTMAHIFGETNRAEEGAKFMERNEAKWTNGNYLLEHNYWHWGLFYFDKEDYGSALAILDDHIIPCEKGGSCFPLCDASSLLCRLEMEGVSTGKRWQSLNSLWPPTEHSFVYFDVYMMMMNVFAKDYDSANSLLESCQTFAKDGKDNLREVTRNVGVSLCEALMAFDRAQYDDVVELILPIRDDVYKIGGSNAQRDVFDQLLINAAIQCSSDKNKMLASQLIEDRKRLYGKTGVIERMEERFLKRLEDQ